jgi:hypothetical protein
VRAPGDEDTAAQRIFGFHNPLPLSASQRRAAMAVWPHTDGCRLCEDLFGHYMLPNGTPAHFFVPPEQAARPMRAVRGAAPPPAPWPPSEPMPPCGLPAAGARGLARLAVPGRLPGVEGVLWVPVPRLAPAPGVNVLRGRRDEETGAFILEAGPVRLKAVVREVTLWEELRTPLESASPRRRRRSVEAPGGAGGVGGGKLGTARAAAVAGKAAPPQAPAAATRRPLSAAPAKKR